MHVPKKKNYPVGSHRSKMRAIDALFPGLRKEMKAKEKRRNKPC